MTYVTIETKAGEMINNLVQNRVPVTPVGNGKYMIQVPEDVVRTVIDSIFDIASHTHADATVRTPYQDGDDIGMYTATFSNGVCIE